MGHHKKIWLEQCKGPGVLFYSNYVDDTFCLFPSEDNTTTFLSYINSWHPNICFAMEKKIDCVLPFLDVLIDITDPHSIITGIFHYFFHSPPMLHKIGVVRTLIIRVFEINNTWLGFHDDIKKLVLILCINVFPIHLIETRINRLSRKAVIRHGSTYTCPPKYQLTCKTIRLQITILGPFFKCGGSF